MTFPADIAPFIEEGLAAMRGPPTDTDLRYHAITLAADDRGQASLGYDTRWIGWHDTKQRVELRQSRIVDASYVEGWEALGHPYYFVLSHDDLVFFMVAGGHALVERTIAEAAFPDLIQPLPAYPSGRSGFVDAGLLDAAADRRAPTPKVRMAVIRRDRGRCRICGRRPDDDVDIVLHVHHIRPWAKGGATDISNLITLCHTCHDGLDPHFDRGLFDYLDPHDAKTVLSRFADSVANYRHSTEY